MTESQRWMLFCTLIVVGVMVYLLQPILTPFLIGALLGYMGDPIADRLEHKGLSRTMSVVVVFGVFLSLMLTILVIVVPLLARQTVSFVHSIPETLAWIQGVILPWLQVNFSLDVEFFEVEKLKSTVLDHWQNASGFVTQLIKKMTASSIAMITTAANIMIIPVVTFYLLRDWDVMVAHIQDSLPKNVAPTIVKLTKESDEVLGAFLKGQLSVMAALGVIYAIGLSLVGLQFALLIGVVAGLASIVPYLGPIIGIVVAGVAVLIQFPDAWHIFGVAAVFGVGQLLEGMWLTPWLVGDRIGLHPVAVIFAIMAGGQLFGFVGILLALPVASVLMVIFRHLHQSYKESDLYNVAPDTDVIRPQR